MQARPATDNLRVHPPAWPDGGVYTGRKGRDKCSVLGIAVGSRNHINVWPWPVKSLGLLDRLTRAAQEVAELSKPVHSARLTVATCRLPSSALLLSGFHTGPVYLVMKIGQIEIVHMVIFSSKNEKQMEEMG